MNGLFAAMAELPEWTVRLIKAGVVIVAAVIIIQLLRWLISHAMKKRRNASRRGDTLGALLKSVLTYVVGFLAFVTVLQTAFNINMTGILAAAGVLGVAVGFGAQSLVKDVISGFFLLFEDQFSVGDSVTLEGFTGVVEELGLRATRLRGGAGDLFILPNGSVSKVINHSRGPRAVIIQCDVAYEADLQKALDTLREISAKAKADFPSLSEEPSVLGVGALGARGVTLRVLCKCGPGEQFSLEREMLLRIKAGFDAAGVTFACDRLSSLRTGE